MVIAAESIPDEDEIHRLIDFPSMYDGKENLIWQNVFQFPSNLPESVIWAKYAQTVNEVHQLGAAREAAKKASKPNMRYIGFISSLAANVRGIKTKPGHGFSVYHAPEEGIHHAQICYEPNGELTKAQRSELKFALQNVFGPIVTKSYPP